MPKQIETTRLILRPLEQNDFAFLRSMHTDPEVMKHIGVGRVRTEEESRASLQKYFELYDENPLLGGWVAELKTTGEKVGNLIIRKPATSTPMEGLEIGYMFTRAHWGYGYATEASKEIIKYAKREFGEVKIVALINPANDASRRTLEKLGFKSVGFDEYVDPTTGTKMPTEILLELIE